MTNGDGSLPGEGRSYSEETARTIDREVRGLIDGTYARVREILEADREILEVLSARLLEVEVVDESVLREIMGLPPRSRPASEERIVTPPPLADAGGVEGTPRG
jgi:cell division protease FtsH